MFRGGGIFSVKHIEFPHLAGDSRDMAKRTGIEAGPKRQTTIIPLLSSIFQRHWDTSEHTPSQGEKHSQGMA